MLAADEPTFDPDEPLPGPRIRWRRILTRAAQLIFGLGLGAAISECAFHLRDDGAFPHVNFYRPDRALGVRLEPGASMRFQLRQNPVSTIHVNRHGYRGGDWPDLSSGEVLVVGDSQVFGLGVDDDATFSARLAAASGRPVINAGVPTYGPREYLAVAEELLAKRKFSTVVVVLNFVNDPFELERPNRERHAVWDGWAVRSETMPAALIDFPGRRWLFSRSHAVYALRRWLHERGSAAAPEADDQGGGLDEVIDPGTPSEGGLHDLLASRQRAHDDLIRDPAGAREQTAERLRAIDRQLLARRDELAALLRGDEDPVARARPGDIVNDMSSESSRSVVVTAGMIRAATRDRAELLAQRLRFEKGYGPANDLITAGTVLGAERALLRDQLARSLNPAPRPASQFRGYVDEFKALCERFGAELVVVALPIDVQVDPREWAKYGVTDAPDMQDTRVLLEDLVADAHALGLRALDATPALLAAQPGAFLDHDIHMTARGHAALADALVATLAAPPPASGPPPSGIPTLRSFGPTAREWASISPLNVSSARALGCTVRREREWLQVLCRRRTRGERFDGLTLREGATPATMALRSADALNLVTPLTAGVPLTARFTWQHGAHDLELRWPAGPDSPPTLAFVPVVPAASKPAPRDPTLAAIEPLCACQREQSPPSACVPMPRSSRVPCQRVCSDLWADPALVPACLAAFVPCDQQLACAQNDPLFAPTCPPGHVHAFASNRCFAPCDPQRPCATGTCTPWLTGGVCVLP